MSATKSITILSFFLLLVQQAFGTTIDEELLLIEEKLYFYTPHGEELLHQFLQKHNSDQLEKYQGHTDFLHGILSYKKAEMDSSILYLEKGLISFAINRNKLYQAKVHILLGWVSEKIGYWDQAKIAYHKAIELTDEKHPRDLGMGYLGISRCKMYVKEDFEKEKAKGIYLLRLLDKQEYNLYTDYITCLNDNSSVSTALKLKDIAQVYEDLGMDSNAADAYKSLGKYYILNKEFDVALFYIDKAIHLCTSYYPGMSMLPSLYQIKGVTLFFKKEYVEAREALNKSLKSASKYEQQSVNSYAYQFLFRIDTIQGNHQSAKENLLLAKENKKEYSSQSKKHVSNIIEITSKLEKIEDEVISLKSQKKNIVLIAMLGAIVLSLLFALLWVLNKRNNAKKASLERLEKEGLQNLISDLGEIKLLNKHYTLSEKDKSKIKTLDSQFEIAYSQSINQFGDEFKNLSKNDIRYAVMFAMDMSDDVIAKIRNINPDSILKTKQRIREKEGLEKGADLSEYFNSFLETSKYQHS